MGQGVPHGGAEQHPRLGAIGEGGRTGRSRAAASGVAGHLTGAYTRAAAR